MGKQQTLRIYLDAHLCRRVETGSHNFLAQLIGALESVGWRVKICSDRDDELMRARSRDGYALFHMLDSGIGRGLTFRLAYHFPFWKIEKTGTRWDFECAGLEFDPEAIDPDVAADFVTKAKNRLFSWAKDVGIREEHVFIPLQGRLLLKRDHQAQSPIDMVRSTLAHFPKEKVRIGLHPREIYSAEEISALRDVVAGHERAEISHETGETLLAHAKMVVTQNSTLGFTGLFFNKPTVLFAKSDFHHGVHNVVGSDVGEVFEKAQKNRPESERFLYWFLQENCINAGQPDAQAQVLNRLRELGWPVEA